MIYASKLILPFYDKSTKLILLEVNDAILQVISTTTRSMGMGYTSGPMATALKACGTPDIRMGE